MIIGIVGSIGSGKTLFMTYLLKRYLEKGMTVMTNYRVKIPHTLIDRETIRRYADKNNPLKDCVLALDEAHILLDCRTSYKNTMISYFILQTRKRGVTLLYTTQNFLNVEKRLREQTDYIFQCSPIYDRIGDKKLLIAVKVLITQYYGHDRYRDLKRLVLRHPETVYKLYDTYEIVNFEK